MNLDEWFKEGLSIEGYMDTLTKHKDHFNHIDSSFKLPEDEDFFKRLEHKGIRALVIAEPWCGHCMMDVPILKRMAEKGNMDISICLRDAYPQLMDQYETDGKRVIPIFIFLNDEGEQVGKWGPRAPKVAKIQQETLSDLPEKGSPEYEQVFPEKLQALTERFSSDEELWQHVYEDIKKELEKCL